MSLPKGEVLLLVLVGCDWWHMYLRDLEGHRPIVHVTSTRSVVNAGTSESDQWSVRE